MRDLEIYIRDINPAALRGWLRGYINQLDLPVEPLNEVPVKASGWYCGSRVRVTVYPRAGGKRYASVTIEGGSLPWESDLECGRSAWHAMETEIRCSPGDWKEGEAVEDERWWRIDQRGEQLAVWN